MLSHKIERKRVPCVYDVSYRKGSPPCIVLRLHKEFVEESKNIVPIKAFLKKIQDDHNIGEFLPLSSECFGFEGVIKKKGEDSEGFFIYEIEIPISKKELPDLCERCEGTGWDKDLNKKCLSCYGKKHKVDYDCRLLAAISASLHVLSLIAETFNKQTSAKNYQLFTFQTSCGKEMGQFSINGYYGIDFCAWLNSFGAPQHQFNDVLAELENVYSYLYGGEKGLDFQAYIGNKARLIISVPGNACGIFPEDNYNWRVGEGRKFSSHNMDSPVQQILILVALAILSDMVREYMKG